MVCEGHRERNITLSLDLHAQRTRMLMKSADGGKLCVSHILSLHLEDSLLKDTQPILCLFPDIDLKFKEWFVLNLNDKSFDSI